MLCCHNEYAIITRMSHVAISRTTRCAMHLRLCMHTYVYIHTPVQPHMQPHTHACVLLHKCVHVMHMHSYLCICTPAGLWSLAGMADC